MKLIIIILTLVLSNNLLSQGIEDTKSLYLLNWYNSNIEFLDSMKMKIPRQDTSFNKKLFLVQKRLTATSYRRINGKSNRELIIDKIIRETIIDLNNCVIIEEYTSFKRLKYKTTIIFNDGSKLELTIENEEVVLIFINDVQINYNNCIKEINLMNSTVVCEKDRIENYQVIFTIVNNGNFNSKILIYPCSSDGLQTKFW
ncbi:MAG: hypothetical protein VR77_06170 [Flavobacteriales bacterium BRH_c54]|nr:MAG: hypothetical protein VR77_06170 [Flavobacteriales bacterium BRH_c54]